MRVLSVFLFIPLFAFASEQQLAKQFFGPDGMKNKHDVYAGEMLEHYVDKPTLGESLPCGVKIELRSLEASPSREIYAVSLTKDGTSQDWYLYLINDQGHWKIPQLET